MNPSDFTKRIPDWVNVRFNRRGTKLKLRGNSSWKGQPVVGRIKVNLKDEVTGVNFDQMMQASYRISGTKGRDRIVFKDQAGSITKRTRSIINFKEDDAKDKFVFKNRVPGKPFNHMQRMVIKNFGREDVIVLKNIGRKFRYGDLQPAGVDEWTLPGVPPLSLTVLT